MSGENSATRAIDEIDPTTPEMETLTLADRARRQALWDALRARKIAWVTLTFSGSSDSGQLDGVEDFAYCEGAAPVPVSVPLTDESGHEAEHGAMARFDAFSAMLDALLDTAFTVADESGYPITTLRALLEYQTNMVLQKDEIPNWWDGNGGHGKVEWTPDYAPADGRPGTTGVIEVEVNEAVVDYETSAFTY